MKIQESECSCAKCQELCKNRPGWGTPKEIEELINKGYANQMMLDYWVGKNGAENISIVSPAIISFEEHCAPICPIGRCSFLTEDNLCEIHHSGSKPIECRHSSGCNSSNKSIHKQVAMLWDTDKGRKIVSLWKEIVGVSSLAV